MSKRVFAAAGNAHDSGRCKFRAFLPIRNKDTITLVLPNSECQTKVAGRNLDQLTLRLESKPSVCGAPKSLVVLSNPDVREVVNNRSPPKESWARLVVLPRPAS
jgi:hypothetical protein